MQLHGIRTVRDMPMEFGDGRHFSRRNTHIFPAPVSTPSNVAQSCTGTIELWTPPPSPHTHTPPLLCLPCQCGPLMDQPYHNLRWSIALTSGPKGVGLCCNSNSNSNSNFSCSDTCRRLQRFFHTRRALRAPPLMWSPGTSTGGLYHAAGFNIGLNNKTTAD